MSSLVCTMDANGNNSCGTGGWTGPRPGDPNTANILIHATPAFGGIDVTWNYPDLNPEAVAYTKLFRSLLPDVSSATLHREAVQGSFFYDRLDNDTHTVYYYWIQVVSVYGTVSEMIGPAWATAKPLIEQMIEDLTGKIDSGVLAQTLKAEIARIQLNSLAISQEMLDRDEADDALGVYINQVEAHSGETRALLQQEVLARTDANEAFVSAVNTVYAELNKNVAGVQQSVTALVTDVEAMASEVTRVEAEFDGNLAQAEQSFTTQVKTVNDKVTEIGALYTAKVSVNGLIGGFGIYNDGKTVEAGFDVDTFWIGRTGANKRKPFIIADGVVYLDEAAINRLTISKLRSEDGSLAFENGKLQAQLLGPVSFTSLSGAKPSIDADRTAYNTAYDTTNVAGTSAATIRDAAGEGRAANNMLKPWVRPNTTLIDGNRIYTGDAYVDTLQIRGNAVTVPSFIQAYDSVLQYGWTNVLVLGVYMDQAGWLFGSSTGYISYAGGFGHTESLLAIDGQVVSRGGGTTSWVSAAHSGAVYVGAGYHTVALQYMSPSGKGTMEQRTLFAMAVKR